MNWGFDFSDNSVAIEWWEYNVSFLIVTDSGNRVKLGGERNKESGAKCVSMWKLIVTNGTHCFKILSEGCSLL